MTIAYKFASEAAYLAAAEVEEVVSEYTREDGIIVSVIGNHYEPAPDPAPEGYEPVYVGFLVNTTAPVEGWDAYQVFPTQFMRVFG